MKAWVLLLGVAAFSDMTDSFITKEEYASQLYQNPRGIGCHHCHGIKGEGKVIATYTDKNRPKSFSGPSIKDVSFERFSSALNKRVRGMPRYFLTQGEIKALYYYLQLQKKRDNHE